MSTIQAIAFRRNQLRRVREAFPEIERPGVYLFIGSDENEPDRLIAYIGESEGIGSRLYTHNSNDAGRDPKAYWTDTVVLISKDENLTKSHARYVEACLIRAVGGNPRWYVPNSKRPSEDAGKLPLPDRAAMEEFVDQTTTLVGALGWDLFREMRGRAAEPLEQLTTTADDPSPVFFFRGGRLLCGNDDLSIGRLRREGRFQGARTHYAYYPQGHSRASGDVSEVGRPPR